MTQISIKPVEKKDIGEAAKLCAEAFIRTPFTSTVVGGRNRKNLNNLYRGMKMLLKAPGEVMVARDSDLIVGVLRMVQWPDCQRSTPKGLAAIPGMIFGGPGFRNMIHFRKEWAKHDPKEPHWHIDPLCVLPERQGQGIGSQLLTYFCERADKDGILSYLETEQEQNERLYNRFGFKTMKSQIIFGERNVFMWRTNK